jgi:hypothetical protein
MIHKKIAHNMFKKINFRNIMTFCLIGKTRRNCAVYSFGLHGKATPVLMKWIMIFESHFIGCSQKDILYTWDVS